MTENAPKSDRDRARACRERKREAGEPAIPAFDRVLRDELFRAYHAGELTVDLLELMNRVVGRIAGDDARKQRGCRPARRRGKKQRKCITARALQEDDRVGVRGESRVTRHL
jgi:hypothetical protein